VFTINGKEVKLKLDLGGVKMLKKEYGVDVFKLKNSDMQDAEVFSAMVYVLAKRGGSDITMDDVDSIDFKDLEGIESAIDSAMEEFAPEADGKAPLAKNRRK
jgi:hypothetical protein